MTMVELLERLCGAGEDARAAPTTVVVVAHPDDEVVGAGGRLRRLRDAIFLHVTDGAPEDGRDAAAQGFEARGDYVRARRRELERAMALAGIVPEQCRELGCVDQQASLHLVALSRSMAGLLRKLGPEVVLTHPYEGGHPDHDATAFAVHAACGLLRRRNVEPPVIVEMTSYHLGPGGIETGTFLPADGCEVRTTRLSEAERAFKRQLFECFPSQRETLKYFPVEVERFRLAPGYDFSRPPHGGRLFYEMHPWGMTGERFRKLAGEAMEELAAGRRVWV